MSDEGITLKLEDEQGRQCALERLAVLDTEAEPEFDRITSLVKTVFNVPIAAVSLIDRDRLWFKSIQGLGVPEAPRKVAFCDHTIQVTECFRIEDTASHPLFYDNPIVTEPPHIRSYIGAPLITPDGYGIGALCAMDYRPRIFTDAQAQMLVSFADLVKNQLELRKMATRDLLTGLATRRAFMDALDAAIKECERSNAPISLVCLDLDKFKSINDTYGHHVGDAVLEAVGRNIDEFSDDTTYASRLGGEELAILLVGSDENNSADFAENLRSVIEACILKDYPAVHFTASFGVAERTSGITSKAWMAKADAALYQAKRQGRNCVVQASRSSTPSDAI